MGWFEEQAPTQIGIAPRGIPSGEMVNGGTAQLFQVPGVQPSADGQGGDWQATFMRIMGGLPATPDNLAAKEQELATAGIKVRRNASGIAGKVENPQTGEIVDVIEKAGLGGGGKWVWQTGLGGPTGEGGKPLPGNQYYGQPGGAPLGAIGAGQAGGSPLSTLRETPGYQFVMQEAIDALDRSASARGTLLTGGMQKELQDRAAGIAETRFDTTFGQNLSLAGLGLNASQAQNASDTSYGSTLTDLTTGSGNARANAALTSGNAWAQTGANLGNIGAGVVNRWPTSDNPYGYGYPGTPPYNPNPYPPPR